MGCGPNTEVTKKSCMEKHFESIITQDSLINEECSLDPETTKPGFDASKVKQEDLTFCLICKTIIVNGIDNHIKEKNHKQYLNSVGLRCIECGHIHQNAEISEKAAQMITKMISGMYKKFIELSTKKA